MQTAAAVFYQSFLILRWLAHKGSNLGPVIKIIGHARRHGNAIAQGGRGGKDREVRNRKGHGVLPRIFDRHRSLTSLRVALATIVAERLSSAIRSMPGSSSLKPPWQDGKGTWRLISIASDLLWALPYRAQIVTGFAIQLKETSLDGERYKNENCTNVRALREGDGP
jgi:hypothetical protein